MVLDIPTRWKRTPSLAGGLALVSLALIAGSATTADAAFPGQNGQIAFSTGLKEADLDLFGINSDGTFARALAVRPSRDVAPAWSPDGRQVAWVNNATGKDQIRIADADGRNVRRFAQSNGSDFSPAWSPDGRKLVFGSTRENTGTNELYVADAPDGTNVRRITFRPLEDVQPEWSPDGTKIAWHSREKNTERFRIYVMNADGSNQRQLLPNRETKGDVSPTWSPDSQRIFWTSYANSGGAGGGELWTANAEGFGERRIISLKSPLEIHSPVVSPDGKQVAYTARFASDKNHELWVARADGSNPTSIISISKTQFGTSIDWQAVADRGAQPSSLLRNGGAEDGFGGHFFGVDYLVPRWQSDGGLTSLRYGLAGFPTAPGLPSVVRARAAQKPTGRLDGAGKRFLIGGNGAVSTATQDVTGIGPTAEIDTGRASVTLSGLLGGKLDQADDGTVVATFLNAQGTPIGLVQIGPVTPAERGNKTTFIPKLATAKLPVGTRKIRVTLTATRRSGGVVNDAYFDNLALTYTKPEALPDPKPPPPVQPPPVVAPGLGAAAPTAAGRLSNVKISPTPFAAASGDTASFAQSKRKRPPRGTTISYGLDRVTTVTLRIDRLTAGRRNSSGQCVRQTTANRKRKRCTRVSTVGSFLRLGRPGANSVAFTGRLKGKALKAGSYRVTASAANALSARFRVVKR